MRIDHRFGLRTEEVGIDDGIDLVAADRRNRLDCRRLRCLAVAEIERRLVEIETDRRHVEARRRHRLAEHRRFGELHVEFERIVGRCRSVGRERLCGLRRRSRRHRRCRGGFGNRCRQTEIEVECLIETGSRCRSLFRRRFARSGQVEIDVDQVLGGFGQRRNHQRLFGGVRSVRRCRLFRLFHFCRRFKRQRRRQIEIERANLQRRLFSRRSLDGRRCRSGAEACIQPQIEIEIHGRFRRRLPSRLRRKSGFFDCRGRGCRRRRKRRLELHDQCVLRSCRAGILRERRHGDQRFKLRLGVRRARRRRHLRQTTGHHHRILDARLRHYRRGCVGSARACGGATGEQRILRIDTRAQRRGLVPVRTDTAGLAIKLGCQRLELLEVLLVGIDFKQLQVDGVALGVLLLGFEQDFLGLRVATVGHIDIGLGHRIDFIGIDAARAGLAEVGLRRRVRSIDALPAGRAENGIGGEAAALLRQGHRRHGRASAGGCLPAPLVDQIERQQGGNTATARRQQRIAEQFAEERRFLGLLFDRRNHRLRPRLRRFGRRRRLGRLLFDLQLRLALAGGRRQLGLRHVERLVGGGERGRLGFHFRLGFRFCGRPGLGFRLLRLDRGGSRWRDLGAGLLLQIGQPLVLQLDQLLQVGDILFERGNALVGFLQGAFTGDDFFLGSGSAAARFGLRHLQAILRLRRRRGLVLDARTDPTAGFLAARIVLRRGLGSETCQTAPIGIPVGRLGDDDLPGFGIGQRGNAFGVGQVEDAAGAHAVHVAVEGVGIGAEQADQHLFERDAFGFGFGGDAAQRFALLDLARLATGGGRWRFGTGARRRGLLRGRSRLFGFGVGSRRHLERAPRRSRRSAFGRTRQRRRDRRRRRCRNQFGRIEQEGVFAYQTPGRPVEFEQQIDEGIIDRTLGGQLDHLLTIGALVDDELDAEQRRRVVETRLLESLRWRQLRLHSGQFLAARGKLDFGAQRLPEGGENVDLAETGGMRHVGRRRESETGCQRQRRGAQSERECGF